MKLFKDSRTNWKYILIIVVLTLFIIGGVLICQRILRFPEVKETKIASKKRVLLDQKTWEEMPKRGEVYLLGHPFNFDSPSTTVLYSNSAKGISLSLPYNPKWGTEKYKIPPYYEHEYNYFYYYTGKVVPGITFGPITGWHGGSIPRIFNIEFVPARSAEEFIAFLEEVTTRFPEAGTQQETITRTKIGDFEAIRYLHAGELVGEIPEIEIIGKKYNYHFWCICYLMNNEEEALKILEETIKTIQFIEE